MAWVSAVAEVTMTLKSLRRARMRLRKLKRMS